MVASTVAKPKFDCNLLLLAHLICADEQIHIQEDRALQLFCKQNNIGQATQDALSAIFSRRPEAPTLESITQQIPFNQRADVLEQLVAVGHVDGFYAPVEHDFIERVASLWDPNDTTTVKRLRLNADQISQSQYGFTEFGSQSRFGTPLKTVELFLAKWLKEKGIVSQAIDRRVHQLQEEILLAGPEYDDAIERCAEVAQKDYRTAASKLDNASEALTLLSENLGEVLGRLESQASRTKKADNLNDVVSQLEETREKLSSMALKKVEDVQDSRKSKHRSLDRFSIAFMGKTKAGKSTLHATITGEGWDAIGVGMQRTTRYNRVYDWKNIRIIDTPGIGAPDGQSDEEIAKSVVEEADVICYVVTNDSIQETEFEFLKILKNRTKPLIVLLNIKNNLRDTRRLEHFLRNPDKLFCEEGESGIGGHISRIKRYAEEHYPNSYLEIIPVMLLAAQMSRESQYAEQSDQLFKASRLESFLDFLQVSIIEHGPLRRSQTLLGSTVNSLEEPRSWAKAQARTYHLSAKTIASKQTQLQQDFNRALLDIDSELVQQIKNIFGDLHDSIGTFANEHWEDSEQNFQRAWQTKLRDSKLGQRLKTSIEDAQEKLEARTRQILEEIGKELGLLADFNIGTSSFSQSADNFFERNKDYLRIGADLLLGAVGVGVGFFLGGGILVGALAAASLVRGAFVSMLKGKAKRRSEAIQKISVELANELKKHELKVLKNVENQFEQLNHSTTKSLDSYFQELGSELGKISKYLSEAESTLRENSDDLNLAYAERIMEWATGHNQKVRKVEREFGKQIKIWPVANSYALKRKLEELSKVLQEKIIVHY